MFEINCETKDALPITELVEFQGGLKERTNEDYAKILKSIKKHGFAFPFFVWRHDNINHVLDGHGRLGALKRLVAEGERLPPLPVVYVNCKDEAEAKEVLLKLNSHYGNMTAETVAEFLDGLEIDFTDLALPEGILDLTEAIKDKETVEDDDLPEIDEMPPVSKRGEIYDLGPHRLMCGDSTSDADLELLMAGAKADLIITDPPYNVDYGNKNKMLNKYSPGRGGRHEEDIANDTMDDNQFTTFLYTVFKNMLNSLKAGGVFYIWLADTNRTLFETALTRAGGLVRQVLIWVKQMFVLGRQDYQWRHEPALYGWKEGSGHYWEGARDLTTVFDERKNYKKMGKEELLKEIELLRGEHIPSTVIYEDKPAKNEDHPTMKPVKLFERLIKNSSKAEDIVLDVFAGSGTTIIAAAKTNRIARVMELNEKYCDCIRRRWTKWAKTNGIEPGTGALD